MTTPMLQPMSVLTSHQSHDWYTPPLYVEMVRAVLGSIDLDPASDELPQSWIRAGRWWFADGLTQPWTDGTVFCNPPYGKGPDGKSCQAIWSQRMVQQYEAGNFAVGILLINSTHGYRWYENLWTRYPVCCVRERIRFIKPDGTVGGQAKRGQTFVYFGLDAGRFAEVFGAIGRIIMPEVSEVRQ